MSESLFILLVDDDGDDREFFVMAAKEIAFNKIIRIETLNDGEMLMEYLKSEAEEIPGIIFLDINMPLKDGFECLREIRELDSFKHLPVIMFSTSDAKSDLDAAKENGADMYVKKPESIKALKQIIHEVISINWIKNDNPREFKILNV